MWIIWLKRFPLINIIQQLKFVVNRPKMQTSFTLDANKYINEAKQCRPAYYNKIKYQQMKP